MRQHYMNLPLTNRTNCIAFLKYMTTYTLTPESPEQIASRMTMAELQEYCKEKINTAKDKIRRKQKEAEKKKAKAPYSNYQLRTIEYYFSLPLNSKENCIAVLRYLRDNKLEEKQILDVDTMKESQLIAMSQRIQKDIPKYIEDILSFEKELKVPNPHTKDQLLTLKYNELSSLRNTLKSQKKKGTKVVKVEPAPLSTVEEALDAISNDETDYYDSSDISFITPMEAYQMFGPDFMDYSEDELFRLGYKLEEGPYPHVEVEEPNKDAIKKAIIKYILEATDRYTASELKRKSLEQLRTIYERETEDLRHAQTYEKIARTIRLGKKNS